MGLYSTETVGDLTGVMPTTLRNWKRAGLIHSTDCAGQYSHTQLKRIQDIKALTASGSTLQEVRALLAAGEARPLSQWASRQAEMHLQLENPSDSALYGRMRQMGSDYCGDDFVNAYLRPLNLRLRSDTGCGAALRQARFHAAVVLYAKTVMSAATRRKSVPVFLEAVSVSDATEIWMEAIRLTGQGCRIEMAENVTGLPAMALRRHEHHLMWCGAGISQLMKWSYREKRRNDQPVMLCGPDQALSSAA